MYNIDNRLSYSLVLKSTLTTIYRYAVCQLWYDWTIVPNGFLKTLWLEDRGFKSLTFQIPAILNEVLNKDDTFYNIFVRGNFQKNIPQKCDWK